MSGIPTGNKDLSDKQLFRRYSRLVLSYPDFKHALLCAREFAQFPDGYNPETATLEAALYSSMVVAYSRPFNSSGAGRNGKVPGLTVEMVGVLSEEARKVHEYVLLCRNKLIAHTDAEFADFDPFVADDLPGHMVVPLKNDTLAPFTKSFNSQFIVLCENMVTWVVEERHRLEPQIMPLLRTSSWGRLHGK